MKYKITKYEGRTYEGTNKNGGKYVLRFVQLDGKDASYYDGFDDGKFQKLFEGKQTGDEVDVELVKSEKGDKIYWNIKFPSILEQRVSKLEKTVSDIMTLLNDNNASQSNVTDKNDELMTDANAEYDPNKVAEDNAEDIEIPF